MIPIVPFSFSGMMDKENIDWSADSWIRRSSYLILLPCRRKIAKSEQEWEQNSNRRLIHPEESIETGTAVDFFVTLKRPLVCRSHSCSAKKGSWIFTSSRYEPDGLFCWCRAYYFDLDLQTLITFHPDQRKDRTTFCIKWGVQIG